MTWQELSTLAVIPARGGSKGLPGKNLCKVGGISLVGRAALVAKELAWTDLIVVSTDDPDIAREASSFEVEVPFIRPWELATDTANSVDVWRHAWLECERKYRRRFQASILLEPTSPLRTPEDVERAFRVMVEGGFQAAVTVSRTPPSFAPQKALQVDDDGTVSHFIESEAAALRQQVPPLFHRNGICYAATRDALVNHANIIGERTAAVVVTRPVANIDNTFDLDLANWLLARGDAQNLELPPRTESREQQR